MEENSWINNPNLYKPGSYLTAYGLEQIFYVNEEDMKVFNRTMPK